MVGLAGHNPVWERARAVEGTGRLFEDGSLPRAIAPVPDRPDTVDIDVPLPGAEDPDPTLFVSNYHWWPYTEVVEWLRGLPPDRARVEEIARSYQGRPIYAVEIGETAADAPC